MKKTIKQTGDFLGDSNRIFASLVTDFGQVTSFLFQPLHLHTKYKEIHLLCRTCWYWAKKVTEKKDKFYEGDNIKYLLLLK